MFQKHITLPGNISPRESEVLQLIASEYTTKEISAKLYISDHTVTTHRKNLMKKLEAKNTAGLVSRGFIHGLLKMVIVLFFIVINSQTQAQSYLTDIEGDVKIKGSIDIQLSRAQSMAIGSFAGHNLDTTDALQNVMIGVNSGMNTTTGNSNTYVGYLAGALATTASDNTYIGNGAGYENSGIRNVAIGYQAGEGKPNNSASNNVSIGWKAGRGITTATSNVFIGYEAGVSQNTGGNNTFVGHQAGRISSSQSSNSFFGAKSGDNNTSGYSNSFFGADSGDVNSSGFNNSYFGRQSGRYNSAGDNNASFGYNTGPGTQDDSDVDHVALFGSGAGQFTTADGSSFFGYQAGYSNQNGPRNAFFGFESGYSNTTGAANSAFGYEAGRRNANGIRNVFFGSEAGKNLRGSDNIIIGGETVSQMAGGEKNIIIGANSVPGTSNTTGLQENLVIGVSAGMSFTNAQRNVLIGNNTTTNSSTSTNQIVIGHNADGQGDNIAVIGNADVDELYIGEDGNGVVHTSSDRRMKKQIQESPLGLEFINELRPVQFYWKSPSEYPEELGIQSSSNKANTQLQHGFIAQEVKLAIDDIGVDWQGWKEKSEGGKQSIDFNAFIAPIVKAIQELSLENEKLKQTNDNLSQRITSIEDQLEVPSIIK